MGWAGVRINYHLPDKAALLHGAIGPVLGALGEHCATRAIFRPHWRFGPHAIFALELNGDNVIFPEGALVPIHDWIAANPSTETIDPVKYLASSQKRGRAEGVEGPFLPIAPNNSIWPEPSAIDPGAPGSLARITLDFHAVVLPLL